ncbi:hypothetical protein [Selenihalanaerobacter shriftii]|uniref:DUF2680 domain-containing protein n=1 Tax=Selenihalanaerobacter shriftii TaxID=142842 RepID=A0A1T4NW37_9FIRM|nr:hypothetical protein [Selenihalanaerobacter shriftii]SJZ83580.1 hypothetical protein SAMN02745118_01959 [Selenihalanaerobacter shriftii]
MKKTVIGITVLTLVLSLGAMAMAHGFGGNGDYEAQYNAQKEYIQQQLDDGAITQKQADYMLDRLEYMKEYSEQYGNAGYGAYGMPCGGPGMMGGYPGMMRGYGPGMMGGYGPGMMHGGW